MSRRENQQTGVMLPCAAKVTLRDQLREAREHAINDAEAYDELLFAFERLGCVLSGKSGALDDYKRFILSFARESDLADHVPKKHRDWHTRSSDLYDSVREARNDALHQGAFARHLTTHAIQLEIVLEDALMSQATKIGDFMVRDPACAQLWQPLSFIRQQMLANSFSYLPVLWKDKWHLISDQKLALYLRKGNRNERLAETLQRAVDFDASLLDGAQFCHVGDLKLPTFSGRPILVCRREDTKDLVGILTAFDLL